MQSNWLTFPGIVGSLVGSGGIPKIVGILPSHRDAHRCINTSSPAQSGLEVFQAGQNRPPPLSFCSRAEGLRRGTDHSSYFRRPRDSSASCLVPLWSIYRLDYRTSSASMEALDGSGLGSSVWRAYVGTAAMGVIVVAIIGFRHVGMHKSASGSWTLESLPGSCT